MKKFLKRFRSEGAVCLLLVLAVWGVFGQTIRFGFVNYDDSDYVSESPIVLRGLTAEGVRYAFTSRHANGWYPLTTLSLMLDVSLHGSTPGGFHLSNVLLHMLAALALFGAMRALTGSVWRSAFVAAVFAVHPLRAESVAWVSARKDVLSGLFFFLTLWAYARYAREASDKWQVASGRGQRAEDGRQRTEDRGQKSEIRPQAGRGVLGLLSSVLRLPAIALATAGPLSSGSYWLVLTLFACALMSKPTTIPLPCVLLLLDFWPLRRMGAWGMGHGAEIRGQRAEVRNRKSAISNRQSSIVNCQSSPVTRHLLLEKVPLFLLSAAVAVGTMFAERKALAAEGILSFWLRAANALRSCAMYVLQTVWPSGLVPMYPYRGEIPSQEIVLSLLLTGGVTVVALLWVRKRPWLLAGWLWYLGCLVPVAGLFAQAGVQAHADRYTYLAQTGLVLMGVWSVADQAKLRRAAAVAATLLLMALGAVAWRQAGVWRDGRSLWTHTLRCRGDQVVACNNLGGLLTEDGRLAEAEDCFRRALRIFPEHDGSLYNLGNALLMQGRSEEAIPFFEKAVVANPQHVKAWQNLGFLFLAMDRPERAEACYKKVIELLPADDDARFFLRRAVYEGRVKAGDPDRLLSLNSQALERQKRGDSAGAVALYRELLKEYPWHVSALNNLSWILATDPDASVRDGEEAVRFAERAVRLTGGNSPAFLDTLAAACAEAGRFGEAVKTAETAVGLAQVAGDEALAKKIAARLKLYRQGKPFRQ